jgi:hypothetical protein
MRRLGHTAIIAALCAAGCGDSPTVPRARRSGSEIPASVKSALEQGQDFELISHDPNVPDQDQPSEFLRRKVIGKTLIADTKLRKTILDAFAAGVHSEGTAVPTCFDPRHAIRVQFQGKSFYLTICFECQQVFSFIDEQLHLELRFYTTDTPEPVFDDVLRQAGVQLTKKGALRE